MERVPVPTDPVRRGRDGRARATSVAVATFALGTMLLTSLARPGAAWAEERNRCGCYRDGTGACFCEKKATCGCPGECEPRGCEDKRDKELQKQIQEETKRAQEAGRKDATTRPGDEESETAPPPAQRTSPPAHQKLTPVQAKQLAKLLDLYLTAHPEAAQKNLEEVHQDLSGAR
jgi:hypothetical protein